MTRAVFHSNFNESNETKSPSFYVYNGFNFKLEIKSEKTDNFNRTARGICTWLNQNYVIRLFGILDSKSLIKYGIEKDNPTIKLIKILRNNVGAHSTGRRASKKSELSEATKLINQLFDKKLNTENVNYYNLAIDSVLAPMKNKTIEFIQSIE